LLSAACNQIYVGIAPQGVLSNSFGNSKRLQNYGRHSGNSLRQLKSTSK